MASGGLSDDELEQLSSSPSEVARSDLAVYFTSSLDDLRWLRSHRGAIERIGLAVQIGGLGFLGFVPADLAGVPLARGDARSAACSPVRPFGDNPADSRL